MGLKESKTKSLNNLNILSNHSLKLGMPFFTRLLINKQFIQKLMFNDLRCFEMSCFIGPCVTNRFELIH